LPFRVVCAHCQSHCLFDERAIGVSVLDFVPPWLRLKNGVEQAVQRETYALRDRPWGLARGRAGISDRKRATDLPGLAARLEEALPMLGISYLERLHQELGQAEGKAIYVAAGRLFRCKRRTFSFSR
jgi:hypothetical protein